MPVWHLQEQICDRMLLQVSKLSLYPLLPIAQLDLDCGIVPAGQLSRFGCHVAILQPSPFLPDHWLSGGLPDALVAQIIDFNGDPGSYPKTASDQ
jgi:hypothetical protein